MNYAVVESGSGPGSDFFCIKNVPTVWRKFNRLHVPVYSLGKVFLQAYNIYFFIKHYSRVELLSDQKNKSGLELNTKAE